MAISSAIKAYRHKNKISQEEFAKIAGISRGAVAKIENESRVNLRFTTILAIAKVLEVSLDELIVKK